MKVRFATESEIEEMREDLLCGKMVDNNLRGKELEKEGRIDEAVAVYKENIFRIHPKIKKFKGTHPYDRLVVIYRKAKMIYDEISILETAIQDFDGLPQQDKFKERLAKIKNRGVK